MGCFVLFFGKALNVSVMELSYIILDRGSCQCYMAAGSEWCVFVWVVVVVGG